MIGFILKMTLFWGLLYYIDFWTFAWENPFWFGFMGMIGFIYSFVWLGRASR